MRSLSRVVREGMKSSMPLPHWSVKWAKAEALLVRGALTVIAGPPGSGKTITSLNIVNALRLPTVYMSNDSTRYTIAKRSYSMLTGLDPHAAADILENYPDTAAETLSQFSEIRFDFSSDPSVEDILLNGEAFRELYGEYPPLTVVDILMNVEDDGVTEQNYWKLMPKLKDIAVSWNTAMVLIHHTSESAKCEPCPPRSAIMGKANQLPELIVTQNMINGMMCYAVVKNRNGASDESGRVHFTMKVDASICRVWDDEDDVVFRDGLWVPASEKVLETMGEF